MEIPKFLNFDTVGLIYIHSLKTIKYALIPETKFKIKSAPNISKVLSGSSTSSESDAILDDYCETENE